MTQSSCPGIGGVTLRLRIQRPKVHQRKEGGETYWYFRYWHDELIPNGLVKTTRKTHRIGPRNGAGALTRIQAESERDQILERLIAAPVQTTMLANPPADVGAI